MIRSSLAMVALPTSLLPTCGGSCGGDPPSIDDTLASAERWVRVLSAPNRADVDGTLERDLEVVPVDEHGEGSPRIERVAIHSSFVPGVIGSADRDQILTCWKRAETQPIVTAPRMPKS